MSVFFSAFLKYGGDRLKIWKRTLALVVTLLLLLSVYGCQEKQERPDNADKTIKFHLEEEPKTLDPQIASDYASVVIIEAIYEGLARLDENGDPYPGAAERWESNTDFTQFTFYLRKDACWSNKDENDNWIPVTAHDFVYAFQRALDPATGSQTCEALYCIQNARQVHSGELSPDALGVKALDDYTLVVDLAYSYEEFPKLTASTPFMPCNESFFSSTAGKYGLETSTVLGNGPFKIRNRYAWEHGKELTLARSSAYIGEKDVLPSTIEFSIGTSEVDVSDPIAALADGTVDAIAIPTSALQAAETNGFSITSFEDTSWGLLFNVAPSYGDTGNVVSSQEVRRAFIQTLSRDALLEHIPANSSVADDIIPPLTSFCGESYRELAGSGFFAKQDDTAAAALEPALSSLGMSMSAVSVLCPDDPEIKLMVNEMLTTWYQKLGYYFNMEPVDEDTLLSQVQNGEYQIALYPIRPDADGPEEILSIFCSDSTENPCGLADPQYDALLDAAQTAGGLSGLESLRAAEQYLNDHFIFYPIYYQSRYYACGKGVSGIIFRPYNSGVDFISAGKEE